MGSNSSKSVTQPPVRDPWRKIDWTKDKERDLRFVRSYKPQTEGQEIRILLYGPCGAGKSSFINSVKSTLHRRMYIQALAADVSNSSFTKKYKTFKIQKEDTNTFYPFVFNDIMGLEAKYGVLVEDIKLALRGHVKDGYQFNPKSQISQEDPFYNKSPDQVHVLILVINANTLAINKEETVKKVREIRDVASDLAIPQLAIITKIDQLCPEVHKDLKNIYKNNTVKERMEILSVETGIPMNCIFPVKNYHEEIDVDHNIDTLILSALRHIIISGEDHIKHIKNRNPSPDKYA